VRVENLELRVEKYHPTAPFAIANASHKGEGFDSGVFFRNLSFFGDNL
jgi:hypothetical protein